MPFPVTNSNLSSLHLGLFLQDQYAFTKETECKLIRAGINDTYLVVDQAQKYVFRVYSLHWRTRTEILEEIRLLNLLKHHNLSISYPLPDKDGLYIQVLPAPEGDRFAVLFSYANGQKIHSYSREIHFQIGALMARLHQVTMGQTLKRVHYTPEILLIEPLKHIERFLPTESQEFNYLKAMQQYLLQEFSKVDISKLRQGVVHLDIWFDNLNIDDNQIATIFDFDFCGNGWLCLDVAYYIMQLHNIEKYDAKEYQPKVDRFISGYESISTISEEEKRWLPMLGVSLYFFYLGIQCQRYENWSNSFLSADYLKRFINGLVKRYADITIPGTVLAQEDVS